MLLKSLHRSAGSPVTLPVSAALDVSQPGVMTPSSDVHAVTDDVTDDVTAASSGEQLKLPCVSVQSTL